MQSSRIAGSTVFHRLDYSSPDQYAVYNLQEASERIDSVVSSCPSDSTCANLLSLPFPDKGVIKKRDLINDGPLDELRHVD